MNRAIKIVLCVVLGLVALFLFIYGTMLLWNWLVPTLFNGPVITFWQAAGLMLLTKILFSGFSGGKHHNYKERMRWKKGLYEKFSNMSPEQRDAFKERMKQKWCTWDEKRADKETQTPE